MGVTCLPEIFLERLPVPGIPSECQVIVEAFREAGVVKDEKGGCATRFELEMDDGVKAGIPRSWTPGLHDTPAGDEFDIAAFDQTAEGFECASRLRIDFGGQPCKYCELFCIEENIENMFRCSREFDLLVNRRSQPVGTGRRLLLRRFGWFLLRAGVS